MSLPKRIYLTGFMAAGKSTIGQILANTIGYDFIDLDHLIIEKENLAVAEIFRTKGEIYFRNTESLWLKEISKRENIIISLGGGTVCFNDNISVIRQLGLLVYLRVSNRAIFQRVKAKRDRPLFLDGSGNLLPDDEIKQKINDLLEKRNPFYEQADLIYDTFDNEIGFVVEGLKRRLVNN